MSVLSKGEEASNERSTPAAMLRDLYASTMQLLARQQVAPAPSVAFPKFTADVRELITGRPVEAARGLVHYLGADERTMAASLVDPVASMKAEIAANGTEVDKRVLGYILHQAAGSDPTVFPNGRMDEGRNGERFRDFVEHPSSRLAGLDEAHVLALRLYSTVVYQSINNPLRERSRTDQRHPFPVTVLKLSDAIKRLRAVEAVDELEASRRVDLFRGMRDLRVPATFRKWGGTETAPMSTTSDLLVALKYSESHGHRLLFKLRTTSFMERGADISFLSAFPSEREILYPPLTFLQPTGREEVLEPGDATTGAAACTVVEVRVAFPS